MNLQRVGQRARLYYMDNGHHCVLHEPSLSERIGPRHTLRSFFQCLQCVGGVSAPHPLSIFYSLFIVIFFLLNGVSRTGTCPINPFLQLLGVIIRIEKHGRVRHKALNVIMAVFPLRTSVFSLVLFCLSYFSYSVGRCGVSLPVAGCLLYPRPHPCREGFSPWPRRGFSLDWALGPMQVSTWVYWSFTPHTQLY